jgi:hypothetical protein
MKYCWLNCTSKSKCDRSGIVVVFFRSWICKFTIIVVNCSVCTCKVYVKVASIKVLRASCVIVRFVFLACVWVVNWEEVASGESLYSQSELSGAFCSFVEQSRSSSTLADYSSRAILSCTLPNFALVARWVIIYSPFRDSPAETTRKSM